MARVLRRRTVAVMKKHSMKMMWGCVAIVGLLVILAVAGSDAGYLLFALPCVLMMGAMVWLMTGGMGGGLRGGDEK